MRSTCGLVGDVGGNPRMLAGLDRGQQGQRLGQRRAGPSRRLTATRAPVGREAHGDRAADALGAARDHYPLSTQSGHQRLPHRLFLKKNGQ
jgi:hypothetical protein